MSIHTVMVRRDNSGQRIVCTWVHDLLQAPQTNIHFYMRVRGSTVGTALNGFHSTQVAEFRSFAFDNLQDAGYFINHEWSEHYDFRLRYGASGAWVTGWLELDYVPPANTSDGEVGGDSMRFIGNQDRDTRWLCIHRRNALTTTESQFTQDPQPRFDGMVYEDRAELNLRESVTISAERHKSVALAMTGPDELGPDSTLYRLTGSVVVQDADCQLYLFMAIGDGTMSDSASGVDVDWSTILDVSVGRVLKVDELVGLAPFGVISGTDYTEAYVVFGIMCGNLSGSSVTTFVGGTLTCDRLVLPVKPYFDRRKTV